MIKEIIAVYQDCVLCGVKGRQKIADLAAKGVNIRKVSFITEEGRELCAEAVSKGIGSMPFYVCDGEYATNIKALITKKPANRPKRSQKTVEKADKTASKNKKVAKEVNDGADTEV